MPINSSLANLLASVIETFSFIFLSSFCCFVPCVHHHHYKRIHSSFLPTLLLMSKHTLTANSSDICQQQLTSSFNNCSSNRILRFHHFHDLFCQHQHHHHLHIFLSPFLVIPYSFFCSSRSIDNNRTKKDDYSAYQRRRRRNWSLICHHYHNQLCNCTS